MGAAHTVGQAARAGGAAHLHLPHLIMLPLADVKVSSNGQLIGGNYTNVTSEAREVALDHSPYP